MKKIIALIAIVSMVILSSCTGPQGEPGFDGFDGQDGLISEVFELRNINFGYNAIDGYTIYQKLTPQIFSSDNLLIYRKSGNTASNEPIWRLIPRTLYLTQGELDYDFDFSKEDFTIYATGNYDLSLTPSYLNNQTFRIVIVPGSFSSSINKNNYADVVNALNIKETQIQTIDF
jgi:hypothetical protein